MDNFNQFNEGQGENIYSLMSSFMVSGYTHRIGHEVHYWQKNRTGHDLSNQQGQRSENEPQSLNEYSTETSTDPHHTFHRAIHT